MRRLRRAGVVEVAIERPDGPVVDALLEAGLGVVVIAPNQLKNLRSRYGSAGNKDDGFDAYVLADTLRTDRARLRPLTRDSDATVTLRMTVRARQDLVQARVAMANQLRAHLQTTFPGAIGLFRDIDSPISLRFLTRFPSQDKADWLSSARLGNWLRSVGYNHLRDRVDRLKADRHEPEEPTGYEPCGLLGTHRAVHVKRAVQTVPPVVPVVRNADRVRLVVVARQERHVRRDTRFVLDLMPPAVLVQLLGDARLGVEVGVLVRLSWSIRLQAPARQACRPLRAGCRGHSVGWSCQPGIPPTFAHASRTVVGVVDVALIGRDGPAVVISAETARYLEIRCDLPAHRDQVRPACS